MDFLQRPSNEKPEIVRDGVEVRTESARQNDSKRFHFHNAYK